MWAFLERKSICCYRDAELLTQIKPVYLPGYLTPIPCYTIRMLPTILCIIVIGLKPTWNPGQVTTYAKSFEGQKMTSGLRFSHAKRYAACRRGQLGRIIELRYGKNGRSICIIGDRGGLPLHRENCWQFDVSRTVAKELGLYRVVNGRTDRNIRWRYLND